MKCALLSLRISIRKDGYNQEEISTGKLKVRIQWDMIVEVELRFRNKWSGIY